MKLETQNLWFTSDTHYSHNNICRGISNWITNDESNIEMTRDFETLEQMNDTIVNNINHSVGENDWLVHLGDWSFGGFDRIQEFREKINCKNIVLILGNHDHHIQSNKGQIRKLFTHVANYEELRVTQKNKPSTTLVLCHYPIISWNGQHHGTRMLHGHQHLKGDRRITQVDRMDVGICGSPEFRPYHIEEIIQELDAYKIVNNEVVL
jgi:calcineurin-like phosphoesterase family protein